MSKKWLGETRSDHSQFLLTLYDKLITLTYRGQRHHPDGYHFTVILRRQNKKTSQLDSVRLEPHPPLYMPSALEAKHWGATYALYRVCQPTFTDF